MSLDKYKLEGKTPVKCLDLIEWATWYENADKRVGRTLITDDIFVSTVFLGIDHSFNSKTPILFETMAFGMQDDGRMQRYSTWGQ